MKESKRKHSKNANQKKNDQLEMPYGTACGRLRKMVLFQLIKELGKDICFQCGKAIESHHDLSMEHKVPWLDSENPIEVFFDLDNISFSHLGCNSKNSRYNSDAAPPIKKGPNDTQWCTLCRTYKDMSEFSKDRTRARGIKGQCRECINGMNKGKRVQL